jgi:hypothetical protein
MVSVDKRVTYVTNEVLASKYDCLYGQNGSYLWWRVRLFCEKFSYLRTLEVLAGCKKFKSGNPLGRRYITKFYWHTLYCTKTFHRWWREFKCECNLCVKIGLVSLISQFTNKVGHML